MKMHSNFDENSRVIFEAMEQVVEYIRNDSKGYTDNEERLKLYLEVMAQKAALKIK